MSIFGDLLAKYEGDTTITSEGAEDRLNDLGKIAYKFLKLNKDFQSSDEALIKLCQNSSPHYEANDRIQKSVDGIIKGQASILSDLAYIVKANSHLIESREILKTTTYGVKEGIIFKCNKTFNTLKEFKSSFAGNFEYITYTENKDSLIDGFIISANLLDEFDTLSRLKHIFRF